jgi:glycosyltransferase involved in cell wall biosynthesis
MVAHSDFPHDVRLTREARAATAAGFDVTVVVLRRPGEPAHERVMGADVYRLPVAHRRGTSTLRLMSEYVKFGLLAALRVARLSVRRFDIVQVHNPPDFLIAAAIVPKLLGARIVLDVHDLSSDMFAMRFPSRTARVAARLLDAVEQLACRLSDLVLTVHEPYRSELTRRSVASEKTRVVLNTVDETLLPTPIPSPQREPFRIVYHGTVTPHYGVRLLVEALPLLRSAVPSVRVEVYGEGDAVPELQSAAAALGVTDLVHLTGKSLPHRDVLSRVAGASVGVIPNLPTPLNRFALSTKLFEYVALGIPVVSADLPTLRAHFDEREVLYFRAGDAESLAAALVAVAEDYDAALERARSAKRRYDDSYRWELQAETYISALRGLGLATAEVVQEHEHAGSAERM